MVMAGARARHMRCWVDELWYDTIKRASKLIAMLLETEASMQKTNTNIL